MFAQNCSVRSINCIYFYRREEEIRIVVVKEEGLVGDVKRKIFISIGTFRKAKLYKNGSILAYEIIRKSQEQSKVVHVRGNRFGKSDLICQSQD